MRRLLGAAALCALLLAGCGGADEGPTPSDPTPTTAVDVSPTTAEPVGDAERTTATATPTAEGVTATSAPEPTSVAPTSPTGPTAPSAAPAPTGQSCTGDVLSQDILGFTGGVQVHFCDGDWAHAAYPDAPGAPEFLAERVGGRWFHAVAIGDPVCQDDLAARGAPPAIAELLPPCGQSAPSAPPGPTAAPTVAPTEPTEPPVAACVINTEVYGDTHAELVEVDCAEATAEWELAEANTEPSWTRPWITPTGWECFVTPHDPGTRAAGSCYGPDGSAYFTLYLP